MVIYSNSHGTWYINARGKWVNYDGKSTPWESQLIDSWYFESDKDLMFVINFCGVPIEAGVISAMVND